MGLVKRPGWGTADGENQRVWSLGLVWCESGGSRVEQFCTGCTAAAVLGEREREHELFLGELLFLAFGLVGFVVLCSLMLGFS